MREIEFRGKRIDNGEWIYGDLIQYGKYKSIKFIDEEYKKYEYPVILESVGQFTVLLDKNGKKIFELDIIEEGGVYFDDEYLGFFVKGDFVEGEHKPLYDIHLPEIIGNVTDNPELLK